MRKVMILTGAFALCGSVLLAAALFVYVPIIEDGTWYSYPAYAWSQGGDPSENIPTVARPSPPPGRTVAKFGWENRSNLTVLLTRGWFSAFPASWVSLKVFGALRMLVLAFLVGGAVLQLTNDRMLGVFAGCLVLSDARVLGEAFSSARPDLFIALCAVGIIVSLLPALLANRNGTLVMAAALALLLPMLHITAVYAIAFITVFLTVFFLTNRHRPGSKRRGLIALSFVLLVMSIFFLKQPILDTLIPTRVPESLEVQFRNNIAEELQRIVDFGLLGKAKMELIRWRDYFFTGNVGQFMAIVTGVALGVLLVKRRVTDPSTLLAVSLMAAFLAAIGAIFLFDSHPMVQHALAVVVLGYIGCVAVLGVAMRAAIISKERAAGICATVLVLVAVTNAAHAVRLHRDYGESSISNHAEEAALLHVIPPTGDVRIIGPAELWPFLIRRKNPLILVDYDRSRFRHPDVDFRLAQDPNHIDSSYLVVNKEYYSVWHWDRAIAQWSNEHLIVKLSELGDCDRTVECLRIYALAAPTRAGSAEQNPVFRQ